MSKTGAQELSQHLFDNYTKAEGLSDNRVHAVLRDKGGFVWVATENGLNRFDGYSFKVYRYMLGDSTCIGGNSILALVQDSSGFIWVGTNNGLYRYSPNTDRFQGSFLPGKIDSATLGIRHIVMDKAGVIWMGGLHPVGLLRFDPKTGRFDRFINPDPQKRDAHNAIKPEFFDPDGNLWLTTRDGVFLFIPSTGKFKKLFQTGFENDPYNDLVFTGVLKDRYREHIYWITTWGRGLWRYDRSSGKTRFFLPQPHIPFDGVHNLLHDLIQSDSNHLWLGSYNLISFDIRNEKFNQFDLKEQVSPLKISNIVRFYKDGRGDCWMAGAVGLGRLSAYRQQFGVKQLPKKLAIRAIYGDDEGIYFGTVYYHRSLVIFHHKTNRWESIPLPLFDKRQAGPHRLLKDRRGLIWLVSNKGLFQYDLKKRYLRERTCTFENGQSSNLRSAIFSEQDAAGNLVFLFENGHIARYDYQHDRLSATPHKANVLGKTQQGTLFWATPKGITHLDTSGTPTKFFPFPKYKAGEVVPYWVSTDLEGRYWIGTANEGIFIFAPNLSAFERLTESDGLPSNQIEGLACSPDGMMWVLTPQGLGWIDPRNRAVVKYSENDGLLTDNFQGYFAIYSDQSAYAATETHFYHHFDIKKIRPLDLDSLPFHFYAFKIGGKPVVFEKELNHLKEVTLHYPDNSFSCEFAAIAMDAQQNIRYEYRLAGFDRDWNTANELRLAAYTNLPPGRYRLEVRMSNQGVRHWSAGIRHLIVVIRPAWWQRLWIRFIIAIAAIVLISWAVSAAYNRRLKERIAILERQRELETIRQRIAQDVHDEAGAGLTKIGLIAQTALLLQADKNSALANKLITIVGESYRVNSQIREIIFAVNPRFDRFEAVQAWLREWSRQFIEEAGIRAEYDFPSSTLNPVFSPELKRNILLILKESLNNAVKYAATDSIHVTFALDGSGTQFLLQVQDFGKGFRPDAVSTLANGLAGMRRRAESIRASFNIASTPEVGTTITVCGSI